MGLLAGVSSEELIKLQVGSFSGPLSPDDVTAIIQATNSLWLYPGEFRAEVPHAKLTAGDCSTGFVNLRIVMSMTNLCDVLAAQLVALLRSCYKGSVDCVIGSDTASLNLAYAVGRLFGARVYPMHKVTVKECGEEVEKQKYTGPKMPAGTKVLRVEELMTTAKTFRLVTAGFQEANPETEFIPFLPLVVDRRTVREAAVDGVQILPMVRYEIKSWKDDCPLCALGSKAIRPHTPKGWAELTTAA